MRKERIIAMMRGLSIDESHCSKNINITTAIKMIDISESFLVSILFYVLGNL